MNSFSEGNSLQEISSKIRSLIGYRALPASRWNFDEKVTLHTYSYSDTLLKELGPMIRPLLFSNSDKIDFDKDLLRSLERDNIQPDLTASLRDIFTRVMSSRMTDIIPEKMKAKPVEIFNNGEYIETLDLERWKVLEDKVNFLDIFYGRAIHHARDRRSRLFELTEGQHTYVVASAIEFLINVTELVMSAKILLQAIGVEPPPSKDRLRPNFHFESVEDLRLGNPRYRMEQALLHGKHISVPFLKAPLSEFEFFTDIVIGKRGPVVAEWKDSQSLRQPVKMIYSRFGTVTEENGLVHLEHAPFDLGRLTVWNERTLKNGMLSSSTTWSD